MKQPVSIVLSLLFIPFSMAAHAMGPLLEASWVLKHQNDDSVVFLDIQPKAQYQRYHIPGAVNAPYGGWRTGKKKPPSGMLLPVAALEKKIAALGIDNSKKVVLIATGSGAGDMAASARVFWTFRLLGHQAVAILNGGLIAYADAGGKLEKGGSFPQPAKFESKPDMQLLAEIKDVREAVKSKNMLIDARSPAEYLGIYKAGKKDRPGAIPGSSNLPFDWLTINGSGELHDIGHLKKLFALRDIKSEGERIHYCHSGNRAALNWFVDYALLGNRKARLYDGSTKEWSSRTDTPVKAAIDLW